MHSDAVLLSRPLSRCLPRSHQFSERINRHLHSGLVDVCVKKKIELRVCESTCSGGRECAALAIAKTIKIILASKPLFSASKNAERALHGNEAASAMRKRLYLACRPATRARYGSPDGG